jgi:hypothetical protein
MHKLISIATLSIVSIAVAAVGNSVQNNSRSPRQPMTGSHIEQKILETVFKYQIRSCRKDFPSKIYFLSYRKQDPTDKVVAKFADSAVVVRKRSQMRGYRDIETGEEGILLAITRIDQRESTRAQVFGSCGAGSLAINYYTYRVRRMKRGWRVTHQRLVGVS